MSWEEFVDGAEYVPAVLAPQMDNIAARAIRAGAKPPIEYIGAGMTAVVFCVDGVAYKVARGSGFLADEAEWLETAKTVPWVKDYVASIQHYDARNDVIVRECPMPGPDMTPYRYGEGKLFDLHQEIRKRMIPHGWTAPEFKPDSYVITDRGPVLVDASIPARVGKRFLRYAQDLLEGKREPDRYESPEIVASVIRTEIMDGRLTQDKAESTLAALARLEAAGNKWNAEATKMNESNWRGLAELEMHDGPAIDKKRIGLDLTKSQQAAARAEIAAARQAASDARSACTAARQQAIDVCATAKSLRVKRDALIRLAHEYRMIRRAELSRARKTERRGPGIAKSESDDEVRQNIPPELLPTWEKMKRAIKNEARKSRTETFLEWVEAHPSEIVFVEPSDADFEQSFARRRVSEKGFRAGEPSEQQIIDYFIYDADDADIGLFSRALTDEVARHFRIDADTAFRLLDKLAKKKLLTKTRDIMAGKKKVGYQWWEYYWRPGDLERYDERNGL